MSLATDLAEALARDTFARVQETGDEDWIDRVNDALLKTSPTMQEEFMTAIRFLRADAKAREVLDGG